VIFHSYVSLPEGTSLNFVAEIQPSQNQSIWYRWPHVWFVILNPETYNDGNSQIWPIPKWIWKIERYLEWIETKLYTVLQMCPLLVRQKKDFINPFNFRWYSDLHLSAINPTIILIVVLQRNICFLYLDIHRNIPFIVPHHRSSPLPIIADAEF
jgi:hypothetical protein